jgi:hypothetical protein
MRVETRKRSEAICISQMLEGSTLTGSPQRWTVEVEVDEAELPRVLTALQVCLADNSIPVVTVSVGGSRYLMEA